jgi:hypothetical protein
VDIIYVPLGSQITWKPNHLEAKLPESQITWKKPNHLEEAKSLGRRRCHHPTQSWCEICRAELAAVALPGLFPCCDPNADRKVSQSICTKIFSNQHPLPNPHTSEAQHPKHARTSSHEHHSPLQTSIHSRENNQHKREKKRKTWTSLPTLLVWGNTHPTTSQLQTTSHPITRDNVTTLDYGMATNMQ